MLALSDQVQIQQSRKKRVSLVGQLLQMQSFVSLADPQVSLTPGGLVCAAKASGVLGVNTCQISQNRKQTRMATGSISLSRDYNELYVLNE
jgi:hypothetical protein